MEWFVKVCNKKKKLKINKCLSNFTHPTPLPQTAELEIGAKTAVCSPATTLPLEVGGLYYSSVYNFFFFIKLT